MMKIRRKIHFSYLSSQNKLAKGKNKEKENNNTLETFISGHSDAGLSDSSKTHFRLRLVSEGYVQYIHHLVTIINKNLNK